MVLDPAGPVRRCYDLHPRIVRGRRRDLVGGIVLHRPVAHDDPGVGDMMAAMFDSTTSTNGAERWSGSPP